MTEYGKTGIAHDVLVTIFLMRVKEDSLSRTLEFIAWITFVVFRAVASQFDLIEPLTGRTRIRLWMSICTDEILCATVVVGYNGVVGMAETNIIVA